jgi:hypothetical protein
MGRDQDLGTARAATWKPPLNCVHPAMPGPSPEGVPPFGGRARNYLLGVTSRSAKDAWAMGDERPPTTERAVGPLGWLPLEDRAEPKRLARSRHNAALGRCVGRQHRQPPQNPRNALHTLSDDHQSVGTTRRPTPDTQKREAETGGIAAIPGRTRDAPTLGYGPRRAPWDTPNRLVGAACPAV